LLVKLDAPALRASVDQVDSALAAQRRTVMEAERNFARLAELRQRGLTTLQDYDQAKFERDQALAEIRRLGATRREAVARLAESTIVAPVSGVMLSRSVDPGQVVSVQTVIYELAPLADVEIETEVDERYLPEVQPGLSADVLIAGRDEPLGATVYYVAAKVDPRSGGAKVRLKLDQSVATLRAGVTADVNIIIERLPNAITVPRSALLGRDERARAMLVRGGRVTEQPVEFLEWPSDRVIVTSGLSAGDQILAQPRPELLGQRVSANSEPERAVANRERSGGLRSL
ncbi:MAG: efflux RND transporter periplasmic adaptor subunit, partial [Pseudomonadales bacterium]|nr:efflux RND transporter periplasmic adaptor subunit [Pseudomonadales bacterium]